MKHEHIKNDLISRSHAHLRAAFRAVHPQRPAAHVAILKYASQVLASYLVHTLSYPYSSLDFSDSCFISMLASFLC